MKKRLKSLELAVLTIVILSASCLSASAENIKYAVGVQDFSLLKYDVKEVLVGELRHVIKIVNPTNRRATGVNLYVPIVRNETARHYTILYSVQPASGYNLLADGSGNIYACWNNLVIQPSQTFTAELDYRVLSFSLTYTVNSSMIGSYDKSSELYTKYTQPEELIESDNEEIVEKAQEITQGVEDPLVKARLIYNFVVGYLLYEIQEKERGALWALENGVGDCSEYSYLFVALCRAAGIPARVQAGFAFHYAGQVLEDGHMWAEYYLENYGWIPVDATWQLFDFIDYKHLSSIQSIPEVTPYANYVFNSTVGMQPKDRQNVQFRPVSPAEFSDNRFADKIVTTVQKTRQAELGVFLGKIFGTNLIFSSETQRVMQEILESKIHIQNAVDYWEASPKIAQSDIAYALERAEKALRDAWMLIVKTVALYISIPLALVLISLIFLRRSFRKRQFEDASTSNIASIFLCKINV